MICSVGMGVLRASAAACRVSRRGTTSRTLRFRPACRSMSANSGSQPRQQQGIGNETAGYRGAAGVRMHRRRQGAGRPDHPGRLDHSGRGVEILDDAPAGEIPEPRQGLQDRVVAIPGHFADGAGADRGRARLRDAGRAADRAGHGQEYALDLRDRAARRRAAGQLLGLLGGEGRFTDQDGRGSQGKDGRHQHHRRRHARAVRPDAQARRRRSREGHQAGRGVVLAVRGCAAAGPRRCRQHEPAVRGARRSEGRRAQAVRAATRRCRTSCTSWKPAGRISSTRIRSW